jgi:hypothetical protein
LALFPEKVRISPGASRQIQRHLDVLNEEMIASAVLTSSKIEHVYYEPGRFTLSFLRKDRRGVLKSVLIRVAENKIGDLTEYVVLLIHVSSAD